MPITQLNGIHLQTTFRKDEATCSGDAIGKGERSPVTKSNSKFSTAKLRRIQISTIGQPSRVRASKITREALKTSSRSIGAALGATVSGNAEEAREWMAQARKNLAPMLKSGVLNSATELGTSAKDPEAIAKEVLTIRIQKHLAGLDQDNLCALGNMLAGTRKDEFPPEFEPLVKQEILDRAKSKSAEVRSKFEDPASTPSELAHALEKDLPEAVELGRMFAKLDGHGIEKFQGIELRASLARLSQLTPEARISDVAKELTLDTLEKLVTVAQEPLSGHLKVAISDKIRALADWSVLAGMIDNMSPQDALKTLEKGASAYRAALDGHLDKLGENAPEGLREELAELQKSYYETAFERISEHPRLLSSLSSRALLHIVEKGKKFGISMTCLPGNNLDLIGSITAIAKSRSADGFARLSAARDALMDSLTRTPPDVRRLEKDTMALYSLVHDEIIPSLVILDENLQPETADFADTFVVSQLMTFLLTCPPGIQGDGAALRDRFMSVNSDRNPLLNLDSKTCNLEDHRELVMQAPLDEISALHARFSVMRLSVSNSASDDEKRNRLDRNLALLQGRLAIAYEPTIERMLASRAAETVMVTGGTTTDQFQKKAAGVTRALVSSMGLAKLLGAFDPFDSNQEATHRVDFGDPKYSELADHYTEARRRVASAWPEKYIPASRLFAGLKWARELYKQMGIEVDSTNTRPLKPM